MSIKNIVFDIGNVLLCWDPPAIITQTFPEETQPEKLATLTQLIFKSPIWYDLNLGKLTEGEAITQYRQQANIAVDKLTVLMDNIKTSLLPISGSFELLEKLHTAGFSLFALTDNVKEIVAFLRKKYSFWERFQGVVVSAEVGCLKPSPEIYNHLLETYHLVAEQTVFIDDLSANVGGALALNIHGIQFKNIDQCIADLRNLSISF
jgi:putative hydrolase of the HAD superfamily